MRIIIILLILSMSVFSYAAQVQTIMIGRCTMEVATMQSSQEHAKGLLGYTERTYPYGGMLFEMNRNGRKIFHTKGMQMTIRIMGVVHLTDGSYKVQGSIQKAPPGLDTIIIDAPDVLEIPENKYQLQYKRCLGAPEAN